MRRLKDKYTLSRSGEYVLYDLITRSNHMAIFKGSNGMYEVIIPKIGEVYLHRTDESIVSELYPAYNLYKGMTLFEFPSAKEAIEYYNSITDDMALSMKTEAYDYIEDSDEEHL